LRALLFALCSALESMPEAGDARSWVASARAAAENVGATGLQLAVIQDAFRATVDAFAIIVARGAPRYRNSPSSCVAACQASSYPMCARAHAAPAVEVDLLTVDSKFWRRWCEVRYRTQ
jgi:hypothetical protein